MCHKAVETTPDINNSSSSGTANKHIVQRCFAKIRALKPMSAVSGQLEFDKDHTCWSLLEAAKETHWKFIGSCQRAHYGSFSDHSAFEAN